MKERWRHNIPVPRVKELHDMLRYQAVALFPYASNVSVDGQGQRRQRLSFYSAFVTKAAEELYKEAQQWHIPQKLLLLNEQTFGELPLEPNGSPARPTSCLMAEALERMGVAREDIVILPTPHADNTALQAQALGEYQRQHPDEILALGWAFHDQRVRNNMEGYGVRGATAAVEDIHELLQPEFNSGKMEEVLPNVTIKELPFRWLSFLDKKGWLLIPVTRKRGGRVWDIEKVQRQFAVDKYGPLQTRTVLKHMDDTAQERLDSLPPRRRDTRAPSGWIN